MDQVFVFGMSWVLMVCLPNYIQLASVVDIEPARKTPAGVRAPAEPPGVGLGMGFSFFEFVVRTRVLEHVEKAHGWLQCPPVLTSNAGL